MARSALLLLFLTSFVRPTLAQVSPTAFGFRVDEIMHSYDRNDVPGVVVAVVEGGDVVFARGYGAANLEHGLPMTRTTVNDLGSVSKQFTAFAIAFLSQQGKLSLDDDIHAHLPEIPDLGGRVTIRHLIHHISGLREIYDALQMAGWQGGDRIAQEDALRLMVRQRELNFAPGDRYLYCNTAYMLLAEVVGRVTGQPFTEWMQQNVFQPLGMHNTTIMAEFGQVIPKVAESYARSNGSFVQVYDNSTIQGAGGVYSTVDDLAKWIRNFSHHTVGDDATFRQIQQRGVLNNGDTLSYAFGITVGTFRGLRRLQHTGSSAGFRAWLAYFPDVDVGFVTLSNFAGFDRRTQNRLVEVVLGDHLEAPQAEDTSEAKSNEDAEEPEPPSITPAALQTYVGEYYSPELETTYRFEIQDGTLTGHHRRHDPFALKPVAQDEFSGPSFVRRLVFSRDEAGRVFGMRVSNGRVLNLWFEKRR